MIVRVAVSDAVVVGQVTKIEDKKVKVRSGPDLVEVPVAVFKVEQRIFGAEGLTHVRVASNRVAVGQEALLFLRRPEGESYYVGAPVVFNLVDKKSDTFAADVKDAIAHAKLLADPDKSLQSEDAKARYLTAAMLVHRYRSPLDGETKQKPSDAGQSRRILKAIADADWKAYPPEMARIYPRSLFDLLGLTEQDGWTPPTTDKYAAAAEKWTKENVNTYRIKKFVPDK